MNEDATPKKPRLAGLMSLTLHPMPQTPSVGVEVSIDPDRWDPQVAFWKPVPTEEAQQAQKRLPIPGSIAPVAGGEKISRGIRLTALEQDVDVPDGFDPWALGQTPTLAILELPDPLARQVIAAAGVLAYRGEMEKTGRFVLEALAHCDEVRLTAPQWLRDMFLDRCRSVADLQTGSLDEAFKHPSRTNRDRQTLRDRLYLRPMIVRELVNAVIASPIMAINKALYEYVGELHGISASQCEAIYKEAKEMGYQDIVYLKKKLLAEQKLSGRSGRNGRVRVDKKST